MFFNHNMGLKLYILGTHGNDLHIKFSSVRDRDMKKKQIESNVVIFDKILNGKVIGREYFKRLNL